MITIFIIQSHHYYQVILQSKHISENSLPEKPLNIKLNDYHKFSQLQGPLKALCDTILNRQIAKHCSTYGTDNGGA